MTKQHLRMYWLICGVSATTIVLAFLNADYIHIIGLAGLGLMLYVRYSQAVEHGADPIPVPLLLLIAVFVAVLLLVNMARLLS